MNIKNVKIENVNSNNEELYKQQMDLLNTFLAHGAITKEQYEISSNGLNTKMKKQ